MFVRLRPALATDPQTLHRKPNTVPIPRGRARLFGALSSKLTFWYRSLLHNLLKGVIDKLALD